MQEQKRHQLEDSIEHTRKRLKNGKKIHADSYQRIQGDNVKLIGDINKYRKDEVEILLQKEMFKKLLAWTKNHLLANQTNTDEDELMEETNDAQNQIADLHDEIEDMDMEIQTLLQQ